MTIGITILIPIIIVTEPHGTVLYTWYHMNKFRGRRVVIVVSELINPKNKDQFNQLKNNMQSIYRIDNISNDDKTFHKSHFIGQKRF